MLATTWAPAINDGCLSATIFDSVRAIRQTVQGLLDVNGRHNGSSTARDGLSAAAMDREHNGDGQQWTARWRIEGDGGSGATARDGVTATSTQRRGTARW